MANYDSLRATVNANITANNNQEITGPVLNSVLNQIISSFAAGGYLYLGVATPTAPGTDQAPDQKSFYLATTPGTYTHLGGLVVNPGEVCAFFYNGSWFSQYIDLVTADQFREIAANKAYFAAGGKPTFSQVVINGSLTTATVKMGGSEFRIYELSGRTIVSTTAFANQEFTLANFERLVYDMTDSTLKVVSLNTRGMFIDLLAISGESLSGLLLPYYYGAEMSYDKPRILQVNSLVKRALGIIYLTQASRPIYLEGNTSTGQVFFRYAGTLYVRGIAEKNYTLTQLASELGTTLTISTKGVADCIEIPNVYNLVFDTSSLSMRLKYRSDLTIDDIPLIMTSSGAITFVDQGLLNANDYRDTITAFKDDKLDDFFLLRQDRASVYLEENPSTGSVFFRYPGTLYLRGGISKQYTLQQMADEIGVSLVTSTKGETGCLEIPNTSSLVYDNAGGIMRFRSRAGRLVTDKVLITSSSGTITHISQGIRNVADSLLAGDDDNASDITTYYAKYRRANELESVRKNAVSAFIFFSDIHAQITNFRRIVRFANSLGSGKVDAIINGGDIVSEVVGEGLDWYDTLMDLSSVDVLNCCGNHDVWSSVWQIAPRSVVYNTVIAPVIARVSGIVQPTDAATDGDCYYYKDYGNVRVIVLCAMVESASNQMFWDAAQETWLESVLADARASDKSVICVNHAPFAKADATLVEGKWTSYLAADWKADTGHAQFDGIHTAETAIGKVSDFIAAGGKFICWLTGHLHIDSVQRDSGQAMINIASANCNNHPDGYKSEDIKNYLYDCFNYIGIDTSHNLVKVYRIGWDMDASLRVRKLLTYDYDRQMIFTEN